MSTKEQFNGDDRQPDEPRWLPCILWFNSLCPPQRKPTKNGHTRSNSGLTQALPIAGCSRESELQLNEKNNVSTINGTADQDGKTTMGECFICYDTDRSDAGQLIHPCACKGDVSTVHHECLKAWLMESYDNPEEVRCKVCGEKYRVTQGDIWLPDGFTPINWIQTTFILLIMCATAIAVFFMVRIFEHVAVRTISVGCAIIIEYICLRFLGFNLLTAYNRAKFSMIKIHGRRLKGGKAKAQPAATAGPSGKSTRTKKPSSPTSFVEIDIGSDHESDSTVAAKPVQESSTTTKTEQQQQQQATSTNIPIE